MLNKKKVVGILIAFSLLFLLGCTNNSPKKTWVKSAKLMETWTENKIQIGDIIIKNKTLDIMGWYGHSGVVISDKMIADFPQPYAGYQEYRYREWLNDDRKIVVMRYKNFTKEFKEAFLKNLEESKTFNYWVTLNKYDFKTTYCSKYIWYLFYKTAQDLGYELNIDNSSMFLILPYDFLKDKNLEEVKINY